MFELEDYSTSIHDGYLNKYAESAGPTLDFYLSDSLQDMLDVDIRSEIANVVGGTNDLSYVNDFPSSLEALEAISSINNSNSINTSLSNGLHSSSSSGWLGSSNSSSWTSSNDFYADVGACVNPISVMPLISSSIVHQSPKITTNNVSRTASPTPLSPNVNDTKSHLTFSPAQIKVSAGAIKNEQLVSHIPKQIVTISSSVTAGTTAPATLATNSALQRKNAFVANSAADAIKKDLSNDLRRVTTGSPSEEIHVKQTSNGIIQSGQNGGINTIKLAPGIGGLTFANSITYNKLRQQSSVKSPQSSPITTTGGTIVLKRDRDSSPMRTISLNSAGSNNNGTKVLGRNIVQTTNSFTPKSIASQAHSNHHHLNNGCVTNSMSSPSASSTSSLSSSSGPTVFTAGLTPITLNTSNGNTITVKSLHQKIKHTPIEPEYPKPAYSYSCLIAMALKNSRSGSLPVSEIYSFMCEHFPYFKTAPSGWKNSVRHNLSLNKCFEKIEKPATNGNQRKGCLWAMNPERISKMDEEVQKWSRKDPMAIRNAMVYPEHLESLERGEMKHGSSGDSDIELDSQSEIEETSDLEEQDVDDATVDNMFVEEDIEEDEEDEMISNECLTVSNSSMLGRNNIVVINSSGNGDGTIRQCHSNSSSSSTSSGIVCSGDELGFSDMQKQRDFDIEVEDIYDAIDFEDDKEAVRMAINQSDIIELSPSDMNRNIYQSPKRARLNVNYSIGPAGEIEKHYPTANQQILKKIKLQNGSIVHHQGQNQQHIVLQTISNGTLQATPVTMATQAQLQQISSAFAQQQRRKLVVNRIASA